MAKKCRITLSGEEREELFKLIKIRLSRPLQVQRSYLLLAAGEQGDKQWTEERICSSYGSSIRTMEWLRQLLVEEGFQTTLYGACKGKGIG